MSRREEWRKALDAEVRRWSAMPADQLIAALRETQGYELHFDSKRYNVEVELLENTDRYIHVLVSVDDGSLPASLLPLTHSFLREKTVPASTA